MKENIPFNKFIDWEKYSIDWEKYSRGETEKIRREMFSIMRNITWDDFLSCTKEEIEKIPLGWIYDWTHITCSWGKQNKVEELYSRYNIVPLNGNDYLEKFDPEYTKYRKILKR